METAEISSYVVLSIILFISFRIFFSDFPLITKIGAGLLSGYLGIYIILYRLSWDANNQNKVIPQIGRMMGKYIIQAIGLAMLLMIIGIVQNSTSQNKEAVPSSLPTILVLFLTTLSLIISASSAGLTAAGGARSDNQKKIDNILLPFLSLSATIAGVATIYMTFKNILS